MCILNNAIHTMFTSAVAMLACSMSHSVAVAADGSFFASGANKTGKLGTGDTVSCLAPRRGRLRTSRAGPIRQVATGDHHTAMVTDVGDLYVCGLGGAGQLGLGDCRQQNALTRVPRSAFDAKPVLMVACGGNFTVVLSVTGRVYTCGCGMNGSLGHGTEDSCLEPVALPEAAFEHEEIVMVAAGNAHCVVLSKHAHVYTWGRGGFGELGHNDRGNQLVPRRIEHAWPDPVLVFVAAGGHHTVALSAAGRVYTWGYGGRGQLGTGTSRSRLKPAMIAARVFQGCTPVMAACGGHHTLVLAREGSLWVCGWGEDLQLGFADEADRPGRLVFEPVQLAQFDGRRIVSVAAGFAHSAAVTEDGGLWTWGRAFIHGCHVPTLVTGVEIQGARIGRFQTLPAEHWLAFAMGLHARLGGKRGSRKDAPSVVFCLHAELIELIARACCVVPRGVLPHHQGLKTLLGMH